MSRADARVAEELLDLRARAFAEEVLPRAAFEWDAIDETMLLFGLYAFGDRDRGRPSHMNPLRRRADGEVQPCEVGGDDNRGDRETDQQEIEHTTLPLAAGGLNHMQTILRHGIRAHLAAAIRYHHVT
jgi:hypothetical protein